MASRSSAVTSSGGTPMSSRSSEGGTPNQPKTNWATAVISFVHRMETVACSMLGISLPPHPFQDTIQEQGVPEIHGDMGVEEIEKVFKERQFTEDEKERLLGILYSKHEEVSIRDTDEVMATPADVARDYMRNRHSTRAAAHTPDHISYHQRGERFWK